MFRKRLHLPDKRLEFFSKSIFSSLSQGLLQGVSTKIVFVGHLGTRYNYSFKTSYQRFSTKILTNLFNQLMRLSNDFLKLIDNHRDLSFGFLNSSKKLFTRTNSPRRIYERFTTNSSWSPLKIGRREYRGLQRPNTVQASSRGKRRLQLLWRQDRLNPRSTLPQRNEGSWRNVGGWQWRR